MASLNPCNHFNATKRDFLELLEALNFWAQGGGSWQDPAELPRGAGTAPVLPFDIATCLQHLPGSSKLTPSIYAPSASAGKPGRAGEKVGMAHQKWAFLGWAGSSTHQSGESQESEFLQKFTAGLHFTHSAFSISISSPKQKGVFWKENQISLHFAIQGKDPSQFNAQVQAGITNRPLPFPGTEKKNP